MRADAALHDAHAMRHADRELLSLALMHARNRTLAWLTVLEPQAAHTPEGLMPAWWLAGRAGWFQERWIARNVLRTRGAAADATQAPLASIEPDADGWWAEPPREALDVVLTDVRTYLAETLEITLDLLASAGEDDDALHWFRAALFEEDALVLPLAALAQAQRVAGARALLPERVLRPLRTPVWFAAQRWHLGSPPGGYVPAAERWAHEEAVPEFEIDAQPVTWQQFAEFVEDGGYDDATLWSDEGAQWLQAQGRRTPRDVEQLRHGVLLQRFGQLVRAPAGEAAPGPAAPGVGFVPRQHRRRLAGRAGVGARGEPRRVARSHLGRRARVDRRPRTRLARWAGAARHEAARAARRGLARAAAPGAPQGAPICRARTRRGLCRVSLLHPVTALARPIPDMRAGVWR